MRLAPLLSAVAVFGSAESPREGSSAPKLQSGWSVYMSDRFCCENNGNWGYQSSLAGCLSRCTNENTPYMTYKTNSRKCRCDRSCSRLCSYSSNSGDAIYQKGASGPLPTKFPTPYPKPVPTKFPTPCPDAGRGSITMKPAAAVAAASATAAAAEGAIPASPPTLASPTGAVEIANGTITSISFPDRSLQYRVYSPENPSWPKTLYGSGGMQMVVYVTNLKNISRPSDASDMAIIEGLTKDNFLVAVVDYDGCTFHDALQFQKDINLLWYIFSGGVAGSTGGGLPKDNRSALLEVGGPIWRQNHFYENFSLPGSVEHIPVNQAAIYVIPAGYTVKVHVVIEKGNASNPIGKSWPQGGAPKNLPNTLNVTELFVDIVFPAPGKTQNVPLLLGGTVRHDKGDAHPTPDPWYPFIGSKFDITLFSWLFNGYAFANMNYVYMNPYSGLYVDDTTFTQAHTVRYLRSQKDRFSLSGHIGTAGVSKSNERCYVEANTKNWTGRSPPDANVSVIMPAVGFFGDKQIWDHLDQHSPPLVLTHGHTTYGLRGAEIDKLRDFYLAAGLEDKILYLNNSRAGHEYNVYDLNSILPFFDRFCKQPA